MKSVQGAKGIGEKLPIWIVRPRMTENGPRCVTTVAVIDGLHRRPDLQSAKGEMCEGGRMEQWQQWYESRSKVLRLGQR